MSRRQNNLCEFGPFRLDAAEHVLLREGEVVPLAPKAVHLLVALVESRGHVVAKDELIKAVWPDSFVEEANLSHHIFTLRKALGDNKNGSRYIETIPRRGYRFVADVVEIEDEDAELLIAEHTKASIVIEEERETILGPSSNNRSQVSREYALDGDPAKINLQSLASKLHAMTPATATAFELTKRNRRATALTLLAAGLVLLIGAAIFAWIKFGGSRSQRAEPKLAVTITRVTNSGKAMCSSISPDGKLIAYGQNHTSGTGSLYVRQTGSNHEIQLLEPGKRIYGGTCFSPDSSLLYYVIYDERDPKGALYRIPALGGPTSQVLGDIASMFSLSPDGQRVTFYRYDSARKEQSLMIARLDGSREDTLLTRPYSETAFSGMPAWSSDGKMIAFGPPAKDLVDKSEQATLYAIDVQSGETKRLTEERWVWIGKMSWTADNRGLFFLAFRPRTGNQLYYLSHPDGEVRRVTSGLGGFGNYGLGITADASTLVAESWESAAQLWTVGVDGKADGAVRVTTGNADGSYGIAGLTDGRIVYVARNGGEFDLWTVKGDGTESIPLTADPFHDLHVAATPDGSHLVFSSDRAGGSHIFRAGADGSRPQQLTFGESDDDAPDCSPDGQWVAYASALNDKTTVWKVPIGGGAPIQLTDFECVAPSFSPDGQFISCIIPSESIAENASIAVITAAGGSPVKTFKAVPFAWNYLRARWMPDGQGLVFRKDDKNVSNLWMQGLTGNPPTQLTDFKTDLIYNYAFARDGQHIILARGQLVANVVLMRDFR